MYKSYRCNKLASLCFASLAILIGLFLASTKVSADSSEVIDHVLIAVPTACTLSGSGMNSHTATINSGQYNSAVGETTMKAVCNDQNGFAIYAVGYTDDTDGNNVLTNTTLGSTYDIATGTGTTGNSQWAMKLSTISSPTPNYPITIQNSFNNFHTVPDDYTLVAKRESATDGGSNPEGSSFKTTYQVYISTNQATGSYVGQVKYTLVHPHSNPIPNDTMLDTGQVVAAKMKTLAAGTETAHSTNTSDIKAIRMADSLPNGFVATDANTVSTSTSKHPIYIFYDNTNDAGIMYFYSDGYQVVMNPDSAHLFRSNLALADISGLETWDSSNVVNMRLLFLDDPSLTTLEALANWDTSNNTNLLGTFGLNASTITSGYRSQLTDISALANWDTSSVTNMQQTFQLQDSLQDISALSFWDTSKVTNMEGTFCGTAITDVDALADWDVSKVENMRMLFGLGRSTYNVGIRLHLTDISGLVNWNTESVTNLDSLFSNNTTLTDLSPLVDWDTSKVNNMYFTFGLVAGVSKTNDAIIDLTPLANWDVSNVTNMAAMFQNNNIASFLPLKKWDVGKVQNFYATFNQTNKSTTTTLAGLEDWDVSSATNMSAMFVDSYSLTDASAINGWDVRNVVLGTGDEDANEGFNHMFRYSPVHPTFTLRAGTWNANGTFIPSS